MWPPAGMSVRYDLASVADDDPRCPARASGREEGGRGASVQDQAMPNYGYGLSRIFEFSVFVIFSQGFDFKNIFELLRFTPSEPFAELGG